AVYYRLPTATPTYTLSLHDALPISGENELAVGDRPALPPGTRRREVMQAAEGIIEQAVSRLALGKDDQLTRPADFRGFEDHMLRSEEHTSELQSRENLVCRLLLEKK